MNVLIATSRKQAQPVNLSSMGRPTFFQVPQTLSSSPLPSSAFALPPDPLLPRAPASLSPTAAPTAAATGTPTLAPTGVPTPFPSITQGGINTTEPTAFATDDPTGPPSVAGDGDREATLSPIGSVVSWRGGGGGRRGDFFSIYMFRVGWLGGLG